MSEVSDLATLSVSTANDELPVEFWDLNSIATAVSIENFSLPKEDVALPSQLYVGLYTDEDGNVEPIADAQSSRKLRFVLRDFCMSVEFTEDAKVIMYAEPHEDCLVQWSSLAQVQFLVGDSNPDNQMKVVDSDVFRFGPYAQPITVRLIDPGIFRFYARMRYIHKTKVSDFEIVPTYVSADCLPNFDVYVNGSIELLVSGRTFYPTYDVMALHNLREFGRGNNGEYFPQITVELRNELTKNDLRVADMINSMLRFLHPPHQPIQHHFIRPLLIFAHVHRMPYLLNSMENALIMEPPATPRLLLEHFCWAAKWKLDNLMRASLVRAEVSYNEIAKSMTRLPDYAASLSLELRQTIADRLLHGWAVECRRLGERVPTRHVERVASLTEGGIVRAREEDLHTFAAVNSDYAFGQHH